MTKPVLVAIFLFACVLYSHQVSISSCGDLAGVSSNDASVNYVLTQDIDCSGMQFNPVGDASHPFRGTLDGNGYSVSHLNIISNGNAGIFSFGNGASVTNLLLRNVEVLSTGQSSSGVLFAECEGCSISNVQLSTINPTDRNNVTGGDMTGGLIGLLSQSDISNCSVANTSVKGNDKTGGVVGRAYASRLKRCYQAGSSASERSVSGASLVGGVVGECAACQMSSSGTEQGVVYSSSGNAGGVIGGGDVRELSRVYSKDTSSVDCSGASTCGGLVGLVCSEYVALIQDCYSRAAVSARTALGGLFGALQIYGPRLDVKRGYYKGNVNLVQSNGTAGNVVGEIRDSHFYFQIFFSKVFYDYQLNSFSAIGDGRANRGKSFPVGVSCQNMYERIFSQFDQVNTWSGSRLFSELNPGFGAYDCPLATQIPQVTFTPPTHIPVTLQPDTPLTQVPTTQVPITQVTTSISTKISITLTHSSFPSTTSIPTKQTSETTTQTPATPTTQTPTTQPPTTQIPTTQTPTTQTPTTQTPTTQIPTTQPPTTQLPTTQIPTTQIPTTQTPTTQTPTTQPPTTQIPTTQTPTTQPPTTQPPTTQIPTTQTPTTQTPTTQGPAPSTTQGRLRKDVRSLTASEVSNLNQAFNALNTQAQSSSVAFQTIAEYHGITHKWCHNNDNYFLGWHRAYIIALVFPNFFVR